MQRWFASLVAAGIVAGAVSAQAQVQVQVQQAGDPKVQVQQQIQLQVQPGQVQAQPIQIQIQAKAVMVAPFNQAKLTQADAIFVGRVVAFEPMDVETKVAGSNKVSYRIAVVQVTESIFGLKKDAQQVRIGFVTQGEQGGGIQFLPAPGQPAIQPLPPNAVLRRPFPGNPQMNLAIGQDGMFAVNKHQKENFYLAPAFNNFVTRENNPNFAAEVNTAKTLAKVMGDPVAGLKSESKEDRFLAAAVLVTKYRSNTTGQATKPQPIDAAESKLILQAIAGGDWTPGRFNARVPSPYDLFNQIGITQKDGYNPVNLRTQQDIAQAMQKWLDENNGKYVIQKLVADPNGKAPGVGVDVPRPGFEPGIRGLPIRIQPLPAPIQPVPEK